MEQTIKRARLDEGAEAAKTKPLSDIVQSSLQRYEEQNQGVRPTPTTSHASIPKEQDIDDGASGDGAGIQNAAFAKAAVRPTRVQAAAPPQDDQSVKALADFIVMMDNYAPIIPNSVTRYYLGRSGFTCQDDRVIKVISLAAQKFVADIANDAMQFCKIRQDKRGARETKYVLTMEDLSSALDEQGVQASKPQYFSGSA